MSGLPPLPGNPGAVRLLADRLTSSAQRLSALAAVLARLRDGATWDGPAGAAFGERLHEVGPVLDAVSVRLGGGAAPLRALAEAMEEAQVVIGAAVLAVDEAEHAYAVLEDRAAALIGLGRGEADPELLATRHRQVEQVQAQQLARARHAAAVDRYRDADERCAAVLRTLCVDGLADSLPYRALAGLSSTGHDLATLGVVTTLVPELKPVMLVADGVGVAADAALLVAYGEGDARQLVEAAGLSAAGAFGGALRLGATAGAKRTATGVVSTARLTTQQRLAMGVVQQARARRDALRASFHVAPARGTASSLLGGPVTRTPSRSGLAAGAGAGVAGPRLVERVGAGARRAVSRAEVLARQRVDRAFLDDWRLASANGPQAQRMYTAGVTLEVGARKLSKRGVDQPESATDRPEGGGAVR